MGFHAVPNCIGIVIDGHGPDGMLRHVLHAKSAGAHPTTAELQAAADQVVAWVLASYLPFCSTQVSILSVTAKDESIIDGPQVLGAGFLPAIGTQTGQVVPSNVTLCCSLRSALGGRSHRGRFYTFPPSTASLETTGNWKADYGDGMVTRLNTLISNLATAGVPLSVKSNVLTQVVPVVRAIIEDYNVDSQRRRLTGRGR